MINSGYADTGMLSDYALSSLWLDDLSYRLAIVSVICIYD